MCADGSVLVWMLSSATVRRNGAEPAVFVPVTGHELPISTDGGLDRRPPVVPIHPAREHYDVRSDQGDQALPTPLQDRVYLQAVSLGSVPGP
jgi:hypothetical protein